MTAHAKTEIRFIAQEELVIIRPHFRTSGDSSKAPSIQLAGERSELCCFEELWKRMSCESFLLVDNETSSMWKPSNRIRLFFAV